MSSGGTNIRSIPAAIIVFTILFFSTAVAASFANTINIDDALSGVDLPAGTHVVKYQGVSTVSLGDPIIVVKGKSLDTLEMQIFNALGAKYKLNSSYVVDDGSRTIDGKSIENYDIIVVGGPLHNAYTNELLGRSVLKYKVTSTTMPGLVIESETLPGGHKVLVIASVAGYTYQEPADATTVPNEPGGGGSGGNNFDKPTVTITATSPTPLPENLHVTAQATVAPGNHWGPGETDNYDLIDDLGHPEYQSAYSDGQGNVVNPDTSYVLTDMQNPYQEQIQFQNKIDQIKLDLEILQVMQDKLKSEQNAALEAIKQSQ